MVTLLELPDEIYTIILRWACACNPHDGTRDSTIPLLISKCKFELAVSVVWSSVYLGEIFPEDLSGLTATCNKIGFQCVNYAERVLCLQIEDFYPFRSPEKTLCPFISTIHLFPKLATLAACVMSGLHDSLQLKSALLATNIRSVNLSYGPSYSSMDISSFLTPKLCNLELDLDDDCLISSPPYQYLDSLSISTHNMRNCASFCQSLTSSLRLLSIEVSYVSPDLVIQLADTLACYAPSLMVLKLRAYWSIVDDPLKDLPPLTTSHAHSSNIQVLEIGFRTAYLERMLCGLPIFDRVEHLSMLDQEGNPLDFAAFLTDRLLPRFPNLKRLEWEGGRYRRVTRLDEQCNKLMFQESSAVGRMYERLIICITAAAGGLWRLRGKKVFEDSPEFWLKEPLALEAWREHFKPMRESLAAYGVDFHQSTSGFQLY